MTGLQLLVAGLAAFRLTWLVTRDEVTARVRGRLIRLGYLTRFNRAYVDRILRNAERHGGVNTSAPDAWDQVVELDENPPRRCYVWTCPYCAGVWISAACVAAQRLCPGVWSPVADALAVAALVSAAAAVFGNLQQ